MSKLDNILNRLCAHEISKDTAAKEIKEILDGFRRKDSFEFTVRSVAFTAQNNHGRLELELPYRYSEIENKINAGDKVDVTILY